MSTNGLTPSWSASRRQPSKSSATTQTAPRPSAWRHSASRMFRTYQPPPSGASPCSVFASLDSGTITSKPARAHAGRATASFPLCAGFSQTETCWRLSLVNGSRSHPLQRSRKRSPASSAIRSSSAGPRVAKRQRVALEAPVDQREVMRREPLVREDVLVDAPVGRARSKTRIVSPGGSRWGSETPTSTTKQLRTGGSSGRWVRRRGRYGRGRGRRGRRASEGRRDLRRPSIPIAATSTCTSPSPRTRRPPRAGRRLRDGHVARCSWPTAVST